MPRLPCDSSYSYAISRPSNERGPKGAAESDNAKLEAKQPWVCVRSFINLRSPIAGTAFSRHCRLWIGRIYCQRCGKRTRRDGK